MTKPQILAFLEGCLAEDEALARKGTYLSWPYSSMTPSEENFLHHFTAERLLRDLAAKRQILADHAFEETAFGERRCTICLSDRSGYADQDEPDLWPCGTIRNLATVYQDHPDYRAEWPDEGFQVPDLHTFKRIHRFGPPFKVLLVGGPFDGETREIHQLTEQFSLMEPEDEDEFLPYSREQFGRRRLWRYEFAEWSTMGGQLTYRVVEL